ncbi:hypothetical protein HGRIS_004283 [Hohenbuehelia grisea]|uniref:Uncharacterized protein n=1 Tax=Hohenbuehelia grisea TaxID=104357 RepID=A0ABR3IPB4_9AGAR
MDSGRQDNAMRLISCDRQAVGDLYSNLSTSFTFPFGTPQPGTFNPIIKDQELLYPRTPLRSPPPSPRLYSSNPLVFRPGLSSPIQVEMVDNKHRSTKDGSEVGSENTIKVDIRVRDVYFQDNISSIFDTIQKWMTRILENVCGVNRSTDLEAFINHPP